VNRIILYIGALLLAGCAATGVQVKPEQLSKFERGKTTYQEVVASLGKPNFTSMTADGARTATYFYAESSVQAATFIPIVGAFAGGADTRSNSVMMTFDRHGVLQNYTSSEGAMGTGTGFSAGTSVERVQNQPRQAPATE
jgi:outer membrane protein assembly factor BamE (lipoprotein component of BamABCDE complex)